jgi:hypothetical protein
VVLVLVPNEAFYHSSSIAVKELFWLKDLRSVLPLCTSMLMISILYLSETMASSIAPEGNMSQCVLAKVLRNACLPPHVSFLAIFSQYVEGFMPSTASDHVKGSALIVSATAAIYSLSALALLSVLPDALLCLKACIEPILSCSSRMASAVNMQEL